VTPPSTNTSEYTNNITAAADVFERHGDFIRAIIRYRIGNEAQADDLFQDFFLSLISKPLPKGLQNIRSYLYRAITNDIIDRARCAERTRAMIHRYTRNSNYPVNKSSPENAFIEVEEMNKMFELIERWLPRSQAQAVTLRYRDDYSIKEAAKKMDVDGKTVSKYISVGLSKIRQLLTVNQGNHNDCSQP
jgi:RNA polymerase sigma factor (sigma-70 family)